MLRATRATKHADGDDVGVRTALAGHYLPVANVGFQVGYRARCRAARVPTNLSLAHFK